VGEEAREYATQVGANDCNTRSSIEHPVSKSPVSRERERERHTEAERQRQTACAQPCNRIAIVHGCGCPTLAHGSLLCCRVRVCRDAYYCLCPLLLSSCVPLYRKRPVCVNTCTLLQYQSKQRQCAIKGFVEFKKCLFRCARATPFIRLNKDAVSSRFDTS